MREVYVPAASLSDEVCSVLLTWPLQKLTCCTQYCADYAEYLPMAVFNTIV